MQVMLPMGCVMLGESHHLSERVFLVWKMSRLEKMVLLGKRSGEWLSKAGVFWAWHREGLHGSQSSSADTLESEETIGTGSSRGQREASLPETLAQEG